MKLLAAVFLISLSIFPLHAAVADDCSSSANFIFDGIVTSVDGHNPPSVLSLKQSQMLLVKIEDPCPSEAMNIRLYLNDHLFPTVIPRLQQANILAFDLNNLSTDSSGNWARLIDQPPLLGTIGVTLALQGPDGLDIPKAADAVDSFNLILFQSTHLIIGLAFAIAVVILVLVTAGKTNILRDQGPPALPARATWSLGRCQMAFWFVLILALYIVLWCITGDYNNIITSQSLTLMGISGSSAVGAAMIDSGTGSVSGTSKGFLKDILQYPEGTWAFHRLQIFVWTLLLGGISIWSAYTTLKLPNFDDNLLILMGISSGLYLGFKFPESS